MRAMNLPNLLTLARILLIPIFVIVYIVPGPRTYLIAAILFGLAAFTDWLDGYLARLLNQTTPFGAFLDPVADKLIVVAALTVLIGHHASLWLTIPGLIIIGREIVISALREWMAEMNRRGIVAVTWFARVKTTIQMIAIVVLLANPPVFAEA
jgi:CDP-diacylglycerol--glycerol-3-phosphate 3-phosphatidyltransferase